MLTTLIERAATQVANARGDGWRPLIWEAGEEALDSLHSERDAASATGAAPFRPRHLLGIPLEVAGSGLTLICAGRDGQRRVFPVRP